MEYSEIYNSAVQLLGEEQSLPNIADYERRAGYLLANFTMNTIPVDTLYRESNSLSPSTSKTYTYVEFKQFFPLSTVFASAGIYYLAAMLVLEENKELSDRLYALYLREIEGIKQSLQASLIQTRDCYGLLT